MSEFVSLHDEHYDERERLLVRIGKEAIAVGDDAKLNDYFADGYTFSGPDGSMSFEQVKGFFASMRAALTDFRCERREVISEGSLIAAQTSMSGIFEKPFESALVGSVAPTGQRVTFELMNFFRYTPEGRLIQEWVAYDNVSFLRQLGVDLVAAYKAQH